MRCTAALASTPAAHYPTVQTLVRRHPPCCSKIGPALMAGNTLVLKPPTQGSVAGLLMVQCFAAAGIPPGVINCVTGEPAGLLPQQLQLLLRLLPVCVCGSAGRRSLLPLASLPPAACRLPPPTSSPPPPPCHDYPAIRGRTPNPITLLHHTPAGRGSEIGDYLTTHPLVNAISFTGGDTGIDICRKAAMVPIQVGGAHWASQPCVLPPPLPLPLLLLLVSMVVLWRPPGGFRCARSPPQPRRAGKTDSKTPAWCVCELSLKPAGNQVV